MRLKGRFSDILSKNAGGKPCGEKEKIMCSKVIDAGIERRLKYEASTSELERLASAEAQRLQTEEKMNLKGIELKEFLSAYNQSVIKNEEAEGAASGKNNNNNNNKKHQGEKSSSSSEAKVKVEDDVEEKVEEEDGDDHLADLLGDDMPVSSSSGFDTAEPTTNTSTGGSSSKKRELDGGQSKDNNTNKRVKVEGDEVVPQFSIVKGGNNKQQVKLVD
jgi:hypothetical protein